MVTDDEAEAIEAALQSGAVIHDRLLVKWARALLADRKERLESQSHLQKRIGDAAAYFAGIFHGRGTV